MPTIPAYPPPSGPLDGSELLLGFSSGETRRVTTASLALLALSGLSEAQELLLAALAAACAYRADIDGGEPPVGPAIYVDGGFVKFVAGPE